MGKCLKRLLIDNDNLIDKMVAGSKVMGNKRVDYCNLSTTIKNSELGNLNCYTVNEYLEQLQKIKNHLEKIWNYCRFFKYYNQRVGD